LLSENLEGSLGYARHKLNKIRFFSFLIISKKIDLSRGDGVQKEKYTLKNWWVNLALDRSEQVKRD
jgi:hypothetical protein